MVVRVILIIVAICAAASAAEGIMKLFHESLPTAGSHPRMFENTKIIMSPSQKGGTDVNKSAVTMLLKSRIEYCFTAEITPTGMPISIAKTMARNATFIVAEARVIS